MSAQEIILWLVGVFVVLPIVAFMVMKFGTAGYFRAKQRQRKQEESKPKHPYE